MNFVFVFGGLSYDWSSMVPLLTSNDVRVQIFYTVPLDKELHINSVHILNIDMPLTDDEIKTYTAGMGFH